MATIGFIIVAGGIFILIISIVVHKLNSKDKYINSNDNDDEIPKIISQKPKLELDKIIIGIDFWSSYSGFSFAVHRETIETKYEHI